MSYKGKSAYRHRLSLFFFFFMMKQLIFLFLLFSFVTVRAQMDSPELLRDYSLQRLSMQHDDLTVRDSIVMNGVTLYFERSDEKYKICPVYVKADSNEVINRWINIPQPHFFRSKLTAMDVKTDFEIDELYGSYEKVDSLAYDECFVYQDENYHVSQMDHGEFGSIIYFYDLKTGIRKECAGLRRDWLSFFCWNGKYLMMTPRCLVEYEPAKMIRSEGVKISRPYSTSDEGSMVLYQNRKWWEGPVLLASFICEDRVYCLYNDGQHCCIGLIEGGNLNYRTTICDSNGLSDDRISCLSVDASTLVATVRKTNKSDGYSSLWVFRGNNWQVLDADF